MDIIEQFKNNKIVQQELKKIHLLSQKLSRKVRIMEVCGTHTMQIAKFGIRRLLPQNIELVSGPGCPVCVTPTEYINKAIFLLRKYNVVVVTFSDLFRVPTTDSSLEIEKSNGYDVEIVYAPTEIFDIVKKYPKRDIVFLSIGFETTMPSIAVVVKEVYRQKLERVYFLLGNKFFLTALEMLIIKSRNFLAPAINSSSTIDGFILPGHLSSIVGEKVYQWIPNRYKLSGVISGFEPVDIVRGIRLVIEQILNCDPRIINEYSRVVKPEGNTQAQKILNEVFCSTSGTWRGLGTIPDSGAKFTDLYSYLDIEKNFYIEKISTQENKECQCAEVLIGQKKPFDCKLFGKICTPENPVGACMVSSEGSCAAYYKYELL